MNKKQSIVLEKLLSAEELTKAKSIFTKKGLDNNVLLDYLIQENIVLHVDWPGEETGFQIGQFLQFRLDKSGKSLTLTTEQIYKKLNQKIDKGEIERGESVPYILSEYQKMLKKKDFVISRIEQKDDIYYIVLIAKVDIKKLEKLNDDFWIFSTFGNSKGEILYTITCNCGNVNVWQMKRTEPSPTDDYCDSCNKQLFDENGKALLPIKKEYI